MLISYAQNFEDVILMRALRHVEKGTYVDVGAHHPIYDSVSFAFYQKGWRGVHVEPAPHFAQIIREGRPDERVIEAAISAESGPLTFYSIGETGMGTGSPEVAAQHQGSGYAVEPIVVPRMRLSSVLDSFAGQPIHWLKIDVEGMEADVVASWGASLARPWIVVIESTRPNSQEAAHEEWESRIVELGYEFLYFDGLNRFYLHRDHMELKEFFGLGPNFFDDFSVSKYSPYARDPARELADLERRNHQFSQDNSRFLQQLDEVREQLDRVREQRDEVQEQLDRVRAELSTTQSALKSATTSIEHRNRHISALQSGLDAAEARVAALLASTSWRLTAPMRNLSVLAQTLVRGGSAWARFAPGSRPRRVVRQWVTRGFDAVLSSPRLRPVAASLLERSPHLKQRLLRAIRNQRALSLDFSVPSAVGATSAASLHPFVAPGDEPIIYLFVDHTVACSTNTGLQRTARGIASGLVRLGQRVRYVKWEPQLAACVLISRDERLALAKWNGPPITEEEKVGYPLLGAAPVPVAPGFGDWLIVPEVPHITFQRAPVTLDLILWARGTKSGIGFVFYDAIPLRRDEFANMASAHGDYMRAIRLADVVWPISRWSANDLVAFWSVGEKATSDTMPKVSPLHLAGAFDRPRAVSPGASEKLFLSVGTLEPRKNQLALIHAFQAYQRHQPNSGWRLVLVGNLHPIVAQEVQKACSADSAISHRDAVSDEELSALFEKAAFTVFPSVEEGFGLPILESLWFGKPCLCANFGSMGEVAEGGGCLAIDMKDEAALSMALRDLIDDEGLRLRLTSEALQRPMISWDDYALALRDEVRCATAPVIYYWVDGTLTFPKNTGIQRVVRQLARELMEGGARLVPVKFDREGAGFARPTPEELAYLSRWNGPSPEMWSEWIPPASAGANSCFIMAELPLNLTRHEQAKLRSAAERFNLKTVAVFYDTIPWKLKNFYPESFSTAHREYMLELQNYDLILPISNHSAKDLVEFYKVGEGLDCTHGAEILPVILPGEFAESPRIRQPSALSAEGPVSILCVGTVEPRKNHLALLNAFIAAARRSPRNLRLVIVGRRTEPELAQQVEEIIAGNDGIVWEEGADDARLHDLHLACDFTVYPSLEEGFGLPILESLWYGKPAICADFGAMAEVAQGGGCIMVDVRNTEALTDAIANLANDPELFVALSREAVSRPFKSWRDYAKDVQGHLLHLAQIPPALKLPSPEDIERCAVGMRLAARPKLSVCISTYNRAEWLAVSLRNWARLYPEPLQGVELFVCDNTSTDHTPDIVQPYLGRPDFSYRRNPTNVGMLGNLRETAHAARGDYIWILGDDDLLLPGAVERVLETINSNPDVGLVYLNYAFTRLEDARQIVDFDDFFRDSIPIVPPEPNLAGPIREICARNENFFTAIYTLVLRRDHAIGAYSQNTHGRPFSTMLTCIPTTNYVLNHMMEEKGVWLGSPQLVVNMNVSWMRYAPLWILERIPEVYDVAERRGVSPDDINRWRRHTLPSAVAFFKQIFEHDPEGNAAFIDPARVVRRFNALREFPVAGSEMRAVYEKAHLEGHPLARRPTEQIFPSIST